MVHLNVASHFDVDVGPAPFRFPRPVGLVGHDPHLLNDCFRSWSESRLLATVLQNDRTDVLLRDINPFPIDMFLGSFESLKKEIAGFAAPGTTIPG